MGFRWERPIGSPAQPQPQPPSPSPSPPPPGAGVGQEVGGYVLLSVVCGDNDGKEQEEARGWG